MSNTEYGTKGLKRELGRKELMGIATGQIIGAGIMVLIGQGIGMTGKSINLAFVLAAIFVVISSVPMLFLTSTLRLRGGGYTQAHILVGPKFAGFWTMIYIARNVSISVYAISFADYVLSLVPGLNHTLISILVATVFFIINIFPTKFIAKVQNILMTLLIVSLSLFIVFGVGKVQPGYFSDPNYFLNGLKGFLSASAFLTFAVLGASDIFQLGGECKDPIRDIPFVLIASTIGVSILYALIGTVSAGVLPVSQVANQNLSVVAKEILSNSLYLFFIIGGALGALATTINSSIAWVTKPLIQASEDGWFPKKLAKLHPEYKTPIYLLGLFYLVTIIPLIFGIDLNNLTNMVLVLYFLVMIVTSIATMKMPKLFPDEWDKSTFKCSQKTLNFFCIAATIVLIMQVLINASMLESKLLIWNVAYIIFSYVYVHFRYKSGKVKINVSYELN